MYGEDEPKEIVYSKFFWYYRPACLWFVAYSLVVLCTWYAQTRLDYYSVVNAKSVRAATIVDAWPYNTGKYKTGREQWEGTFRDDVTGHFYTYEMSGGLYQKFLREKSGKGIPVEVYMSPSRAGVPEAENADNRTVAYELARIFGVVVSLVLLIITIIFLREGYTTKKRKRAEEAERERKKQVDRENYEARVKCTDRGRFP